MKVEGKPFRTIGWSADRGAVDFIDQTLLPGTFRISRATTVAEIAHAIASMQVRGAPLIGVAAVFGLALAVRADASDRALGAAAEQLIKTRPTAINLRWAVEWGRAQLLKGAEATRARRAEELAVELADQEYAISRKIAEHGVKLIAAAHQRAPKRPVQVMTHCNAGWLATVDWGTAIAPVYLAQSRGIPVHVWVSETRPRNQGLLTAWELRQQGVPHTVIVDNAAGLLLQWGDVDLVIVGTDRTSAQGDVCNKVGTYLKALAAHAHQVPFYAAVPSSSIDWSLEEGVKGTPIEQRDPAEVRLLGGVELLPADSPVSNYGFDVTPAHLVTGLITERGVCAASRAGLAALFPERRVKYYTQRRALLEAAQKMNTDGLNHGTSGNVSLRVEDGILVTPTGLAYDELAPDDLVEVRWDGDVPSGQRTPSSEWRMHRDIYQGREEAKAIFHTHPMFCTTLSCLRKPIPAVHYMIAVTGASVVQCARYATFGTAELSAAASDALRGSKACLLANHGMVALGGSLKDAYRVASEVENLAAQYWRALQVGEPFILDDAEMARVIERFRTYGQQGKPGGRAKAT